jgi:TRAP-type C4-dicarboxylate transport system permease small subunit
MQDKMKKVFDYSAISACVVLFSLAILTFCDVFGRRFLNSPVMGTIELVEIGMALVAFLAMPRAFFLNSHVSADFINQISNNNFKKFILFLKFLLMIIIMSLMAYATTLTAYSFSQNGRVTLELELYFYPFFYVIAIAMWISVLAIIFWFIKIITKQLSNQKNL